MDQHTLYDPAERTNLGRQAIQVNRFTARIGHPIVPLPALQIFYREPLCLASMVSTIARISGYV
jgi:hypothetical protein